MARRIRGNGTRAFDRVRIKQAQIVTEPVRGFYFVRAKLAECTEC